MKPPTTPLELIGPRDRLLLLALLETHPAFHLYVQRLQEVLAMDIDAKIFDVETSDEECRLLRQVRQRLTKEYTPEKILAKLTIATEAERDRMEKEAQRREKG